MVGYSLGFLVLLGAGVLASLELAELAAISASLASLATTVLVGLPLAFWVWRIMRSEPG
jgi:hypothetical protein